MKYLSYLLLCLYSLTSCRSGQSDEDLAQGITGDYKITQVAFDGKRSLSDDIYKTNNLGQAGNIQVLKLDKSVIFVKVVLAGQEDLHKIKYTFFGTLQRKDRISQEIFIYDSETKEKVGLYKNSTLGFNLYPNTISENVTLLAKK